MSPKLEWRTHAKTTRKRNGFLIVFVVVVVDSIVNDISPKLIHFLGVFFPPLLTFACIFFLPILWETTSSLTLG